MPGSLFSFLFRKNFLLFFFILVFLSHFHVDPVWINADDWGPLTIYNELFSEPFSEKTIDSLKEWNFFARPFSPMLFFPFIFLFNSNALMLNFSFHLLSVAVILAMLFLNYLLFSRHYGKQTALLATFLLSTSYAIGQIVGYTGSINIPLLVVFILAITLLLLEKPTKKNSLAIAAISFFAMLNRETIILLLFPMFLFVFALDAKKILGKKKELKDFLLFHTIRFVPFVLFFSYLFFFANSGQGVVGGFQSGLMQDDYLLALQNFFLLHNEYFQFFSYYLLLPVFAVAIFFTIVSLYLNKKLNLAPIVNRKKNFSIGWLFSFLEKHKLSVLLFLWFFGALVVLILSNYQAYRYMIPLLPVIFVFFSKIFCDNVLSFLSEKQKLFFSLSLGFFLFFSILFFNAGFLSSLFGLSGTNLLLNIVFFVFLAACFVVPIVLALKNFVFNRTFFFSVALSVFLVLLFFSSIVQLNENYAFFSVHYSNSEAAFKANQFVAKDFPAGARLFIVQGLSWIWTGSLQAMNRGDIVFVGRIPEFSELKKGDYLVYNSLEGHSAILDFVGAHSNNFLKIAAFGSEYRKNPRSTLDKSMLFSKFLLFEFFDGKQPEIIVFKFVP